MYLKKKEIASWYALIQQLSIFCNLVLYACRANFLNVISYDVRESLEPHQRSPLLGQGENGVIVQSFKPRLENDVYLATTTTTKKFLNEAAHRHGCVRSAVSAWGSYPSDQIWHLEFDRVMCDMSGQRQQPVRQTHREKVPSDSQCRSS